MAEDEKLSRNQDIVMFKKAFESLPGEKIAIVGCVKKKYYLILMVQMLIVRLLT